MHTKCSEVEILRAVCEFCATDVFFVYFPMFLYLYVVLKCATDPTHFFSVYTLKVFCFKEKFQLCSSISNGRYLFLYRIISFFIDNVLFL